MINLYINHTSPNNPTNKTIPMNTSNCNTIDHLRQPMIFDMAIFDLATTFLFAVLVNYVISKTICSSVIIEKNGKQTVNTTKFTFTNTMLTFVIIIAFVISIHEYLGIPTMLNYYLGLCKYADVIANRRVC